MSRKITTELFRSSARRPTRILTRFTLDENAKQEYCILVVDDDQVTRKLYTDVLQADGFVRTYVAANDTEVLNILDKTYPDLVIMDLNLKLSRELERGRTRKTKLLMDSG